MTKNLEKKKKNIVGNLITLGQEYVGTTSIIYRYVENSFLENYLATIGMDSKYKKINLPKEKKSKLNY